MREISFFARFSNSLDRRFLLSWTYVFYLPASYSNNGIADKGVQDGA